MLYAGTTEYLELPKCENVQVRSISREVNLAWLAGIIDGEGNIHFGTQNQPSGKNGQRNDYFSPKVRITNTDVRMIKRIAEIYVSENLVFFYALNSVNRYKNRKASWKNQMEITITSQASIRKLLEAVLPYLVNKQRLAEIMLEIIGWVQSQPHRGCNSTAGQNYCLKPEFSEMLGRAAEERKFFVDPSTITRKARSVISW